MGESCYRGSSGARWRTLAGLLQGWSEEGGPGVAVARWVRVRVRERCWDHFAIILANEGRCWRGLGALQPLALNTPGDAVGENARDMAPRRREGHLNLDLKLAPDQASLVDLIVQGVHGSKCEYIHEW